MAWLRSFVNTEGKSFEISRWRNAKPEEEFGIIERGKGRVFTSKLSNGGAWWLGKLLVQLSLNSVAFGTVFTYDDRFLKIKATVRVNRGGIYIHCLIIPKPQRTSRAACLCFPAGIDGEGWGKVGGKIKDLLPISNQKCINEHTSNEAGVKERDNRTYANVCANNHVTTSDPKISIQEVGGALGDSWWSPVVFCHYEGSNPDWFWVREKIRSACGEVIIKVTEEGDAFMVFSDDEAKDKLLSLPPLQTWDGCYMFRKWSRAEGSIEDKYLKGDVKLTFYGIPYHLRTKIVVKALAQKCGKNYKVDEESIDACKASSSVVIKGCQWGKIPRVLMLEDRGFSVSILVEAARVVMMENDYQTGILPERYSGEEPIGSTISPIRREHVGQVNSANSNPFVDDFVDETSGVGDQNRFQPLMLAGSNEEVSPLQAVQEMSSEIIEDGVHHSFTSMVSLDSHGNEEEMITPSVRPKNVKRARKQPKKQKFGPFFGPQKRWWLTNHKRNFIKRPPLLSRNFGAQSFAQHAQPLQVLSPIHSPIQDNAMDIPSSSSSLPARSYNQFLERKETTETIQLNNISKQDLVSSLLACSSDEDYRRWIQWV
ncbi:hypothetical protein FRX31_012083, partial [Thalictrum thalictroides]